LKRLQTTVTEFTAQIEEEQRQRDEAREAAAVAERRANMIVGELEELRTALEQAERARKAAENELNEAADRISEVSTQNANLSSQRRQLESAVAAMQADLDEAVAELKNSEERSRKAGTFFS
jgi:predicted  nucleic acid-binding Zn-ribbon protein